MRMTAHWEFAWGPEHFFGLAGRLNYPMLAINCYDTASGDRPFAPSTIVERAGLRIGVIGIAATIIDKTMPKHFSEGLWFTSGFAELPAEIARLKNEQKADLIVVLSHLGFPQDFTLASAVSGIDILLSGHTHNRIEQPIRAGGALIIQSGCHGSFVGRLDLTIAGGRITDVRHALVPVDASIAPDPDMQALVDGVMRPHRAMLNEIVGQTTVGLHRNNNLFAPMDDVLLAAIADAGSADIAFSNGWRYGAPIPPGPVTMNDLWNIIPTNPPVSTVELTGAEIKAMMEGSLESTFSADPLGQMGGYLKRFRGLTIYGKLENPAGHRIEHIFAAGAPLAPDRTYKSGLRHRAGRAAKIRHEPYPFAGSGDRRVAHLFLCRTSGHQNRTGAFHSCVTARRQTCCRKDQWSTAAGMSFRSPRFFSRRRSKGRQPPLPPMQNPSRHRGTVRAPPLVARVTGKWAQAGLRPAIRGSPV